MPIDFIGVKSGDEGSTSKAKKLWKVKFCKKSSFSNFRMKNQVKIDKKSIFSNNFLFTVTRRAGWSHPTSKSNTVLGKIEKTRSATPK